MDKKIDFVNCSEDECVEFAEKVIRNEFKDEQLMEIFDYFKNENYTVNEAINLIKNVVLIRKKVDLQKTVFKACSGRLLLTVADLVTEVGSINYKILYALCLSQFNEDETKLKKSARKEIIYEIENYFYCLIDEDENLASYLKEKFYDLVNEDGRFN